MTAVGTIAVRESASVALRRKCACGGSGEGECESCKRKATALQRRPGGHGSGAPRTAPPIVHDVLRSTGQPLDRSTRAVLEPLFRHDFSRVRVHADARAAESASAVSAKAYAVGEQIVFNRGEYQPRTAAGLGSLAHELVHVVQQIAGGVGPVPDHLPIGATGDAAEREAERAGAMDWSRATLAVRDRPCLRRQPQEGDKPEKQPPPVIPLPHPLDRLDIKPIIPGPIDAPSLEDINKGLANVGDQGPGGNVTCAPGWHNRYEGYCCPGPSADPVDCCPIKRLTSTGLCCAVGQYADGDQCKAAPARPAGGGGGTSGGTQPPRRALPRPGHSLMQTPLTTSVDIHFKQNQPGAVVGSRELRDSMTATGAIAFDALVSWLKTGLQFSVQLTGKASIEGPAAHNRDLGEFRARSVANALIGQGIWAGRIADPPGLPASCTRLEEGIHNCGDTLASKSIDERDRQVRATLFIAPQNP